MACQWQLPFSCPATPATTPKGWQDGGRVAVERAVYYLLLRDEVVGSTPVDAAYGFTPFQLRSNVTGVSGDASLVTIKNR